MLPGQSQGYMLLAVCTFVVSSECAAVICITITYQDGVICLGVDMVPALSPKQIVYQTQQER